MISGVALLSLLSAPRFVSVLVLVVFFFLRLGNHRVGTRILHTVFPQRSQQHTLQRNTPQLHRRTDSGLWSAPAPATAVAGAALELVAAEVLLVAAGALVGAAVVFLVGAVP